MIYMVKIMLVILMLLRVLVQNVHSKKTQFFLLLLSLWMGRSMTVLQTIIMILVIIILVNLIDTHHDTIANNDHEQEHEMED